MRARRIPQPGIWNVVHIEDCHHLSLMPMWIGSKKQRMFWCGLGKWLKEVDAARLLVDRMDGGHNVDVSNARTSLAASHGPLDPARSQCD
jgi:hypothetical protein